MLNSRTTSVQPLKPEDQLREEILGEEVVREIKARELRHLKSRSVSLHFQEKYKHVEPKDQAAILRIQRFVRSRCYRRINPKGYHTASFISFFNFKNNKTPLKKSADLTAVNELVRTLHTDNNCWDHPFLNSPSIDFGVYLAATAFDMGKITLNQCAFIFERAQFMEDADDVKTLSIFTADGSFNPALPENYRLTMQDKQSLIRQLPACELHAFYIETEEGSVYIFSPSVYVNMDLRDPEEIIKLPKLIDPSTIIPLPIIGSFTIHDLEKAVDNHARYISFTYPGANNVTKAHGEIASFDNATKVMIHDWVHVTVMREIPHLIQDAVTYTKKIIRDGSGIGHWSKELWLMTDETSPIQQFQPLSNTFLYFFTMLEIGNTSFKESKMFFGEDKNYFPASDLALLVLINMFTHPQAWLTYRIDIRELLFDRTFFSTISHLVQREETDAINFLVKLRKVVEITHRLMPTVATLPLVQQVGLVRSAIETRDRKRKTATPFALEDLRFFKTTKAAGGDNTVSLSVKDKPIEECLRLDK